MRVSIVDPPAYTPPYDRALAAALARAGLDVELITSRFAHGAVPPAEGFAAREGFYRLAGRLGESGLAGRGRIPSGALRALKGVEHGLGMLALRRALAAADVVHYQWLTFPRLDAALLPARRPRLLTPHGWLRGEAWAERPSRGLRRLFDSMDAIVALSEYGRERLAGAGVEARRLHVIPHGAFEHLTRQPDELPLSPELGAVDVPVVLQFGLLRPYKGTDVLLRAFASLPAGAAELWIVGRPLGVDVSALEALAGRCRARVRLITRFVSDRELPALFRRADVVALPYTDAEQSGVLYTAMAFARPMVMSSVGGFPEVAAHGAGKLVPPGETEPLAAALAELVADPAARRRLADAARDAAAGPYSWERIGERTRALYERLLAG